MSWTQLDKAQSEDFIKSVADPNEPALFELSLCDTYTTPLNFYDGYSLYRIVNKHSIPSLTLDYLSNGENHYYLDGSEAAFHALNARNAISLNAKNVTAYMDLYISYVYERGNSLEFFYETDKDNEIKLIAEREDHHILSTPLRYQSRTIQCELKVTNKGEIHISAPVSTSFLTTLNTTLKPTYTHPHQENIIERTKTLLSETRKGSELLSYFEQSKADLRIFSSPDYQTFITNNGIIYLTMPAAEQNPKYMQVIMLAYAIRGIEQIKAGHIHPNPNDDNALYLMANYSKNLDMLAESCIMIKEYEDMGIEDAHMALKEMGLERVYNAQINGQNEKELIVEYINALKDLNAIQG